MVIDHLTYQTCWKIRSNCWLKLNLPRAAHFKLDPSGWWPQFLAHRAAHLEPPGCPSRTQGELRTSLSFQYSGVCLNIGI